MRRWIEKQRCLLDFTLSSLLRRKGKNIALAVVYTLIVFTLASVMMFTQALKKEASLILRETPEILVQKLAAGRHDLIPLSYASRIGQIRGVAEVKGRLWGYYFDPVMGANYTVMVSEDPSLDEGEILVGKGISRLRQVYKSNILSFRGCDGNYLAFKIKGTFEAESEIIASDLVLCSESDFRRLFGTPGGYATDLTVKVKNRKEIPTIAAKILQILPDTRPIRRDEILRTYDAVFDWRGGILLAVLAGAVLAFIIFAWDRAAGLSAEERREIGILKAIGWETADVLQMKFWEGLTISLSSFLLGILLAYGHVHFFSAGLFEPVLKGWSVLYPKFKLVPYVDPYQVATLFFFTVMPYTVATIVPSWRAATIDPDSVMRY
ncbi:MAG: FtsX-like permease family protein [Deltaproteobacteria bacterium]|nr:FtsX-like permease family protein [Deltaproteobacteria bacterium]